MRPGEPSAGVLGDLGRRGIRLRGGEPPERAEVGLAHRDERGVAVEGGASPRLGLRGLATVVGRGREQHERGPELAHRRLGIESAARREVARDRGELHLVVGQLRAGLVECRLVVEGRARAVLQRRTQSAVGLGRHPQGRHARVGLRLGDDVGGRVRSLAGASGTASVRDRERERHHGHERHDHDDGADGGRAAAERVQGAITAASTSPSHARLSPAPAQTGTTSGPDDRDGHVRRRDRGGEAEQRRRRGRGRRGAIPARTPRRARRARAGRRAGWRRPSDPATSTDRTSSSQPPQPPLGRPRASCHAVGTGPPTGTPGSASRPSGRATADLLDDERQGEHERGDRQADEAHRGTPAHRERDDPADRRGRARGSAPRR